MSAREIEPPDVCNASVDADVDSADVGVGSKRKSDSRGIEPIDQEFYKDRMQNAEAALIAYQKDATTTIANIKILHEAELGATKELLRTNVRIINMKNEEFAANMAASAKNRSDASDAAKMHEKLYATQKNLIKCVTDEVNNLNCEVEKLKKALGDKDVEMGKIRVLDEMNLEGIQLSVSKLRYATEFGESLERGSRVCPVELSPFMPTQAVLMLRSACQCNCFVKYDSAGPLIEKFNSEEGLRCLTCNSDVHELEATTAANAEKIFSWLDVEKATACESIEEIHASHMEKIDEDRENKTMQDTADLRQQLAAIRGAASGALSAIGAVTAIGGE